MAKSDPLQAGLHSVFARLPGFYEQLERILGAPSNWAGLHTALIRDELDVRYCATLLKQELSDAHFRVGLNPSNDPFENDLAKGRIVAAQLTWERFVDSLKE